MPVQMPAGFMPMRPRAHLVNLIVAGGRSPGPRDFRPGRSGSMPGTGNPNGRRPRHEIVLREIMSWHGGAPEALTGVA
jgi:hypothetical protein